MIKVVELVKVGVVKMVDMVVVIVGVLVMMGERCFWKLQ